MAKHRASHLITTAFFAFFTAAIAEAQNNLLNDGFESCAVPIGAQGVQVAPSSAGLIRFTLVCPGRISIAISSASGEIVRALSNTEPFAAGSHSVAWDGKNDDGQTLPAGAYSYKILQTPAGLSAEYLMTLQTTLPIGSSWSNYAHWFGSYPLNADREVGIGNHIGPTAVAVDATGIYLGAGGAENISDMTRLSLDGARRVWSTVQPDVSMGRMSLGVMDAKLYTLQQNSWVGIQGIDEPNFPTASLGDRPGISGNFVGTRWDALLPGDVRGNSQDWSQPIGAPMDMAVSNAGGTAQLALSYKLRNLVHWRTPSTGQVLETITVSAPTGLAFDAQGRLLILSDGRLLRVARGGGAPVVLVNGLDAPYRVTVDASNGDILIAERGTDQRVKRFSSTGVLRTSYGRLGGRQDGLYVPADFRQITDITADSQGGFYVSEHAAPRRFAQFNASGALVREWYAGAFWSPSAYPEPGNLGVVWALSERYVELNDFNSAEIEFMRLELDLAQRTWRVHSTYRTATMPRNSLVLNNILPDGAGIATLRPRRVDGRLYLALDAVSRGFASVFQVDESNWLIKPAAQLEFRGEWQSNFLWSDANGDGLGQENEIRRFSNPLNYYSYSLEDLRSDENLNYFGISKYDGILRFPVTGFNSLGAPVYAPLRSQSASSWAALPPELNDANGMDRNYILNHPLAFAPDGSVYGAFGIGDNGWGSVDGALVPRFAQDGTLVWKRKLGVGSYIDNRPANQILGVSLWSTFRSNIGFVRDSLVTQDFNGGNTNFGGQAITYVWDRDGLWVGGLFDQIDLSRVGRRWYNLSSDNGAGAIVEEPGTANAIYFGSTEAATHVYRIRGWDRWQRASGSISRP
jgi:hypothetical protein